MEEQEISLRELIEVLLKNKFLIAGITLVSILISFMLSFYVIEPTYEAEAKLLVADLKINQPKIEGIENIIDSLSNYPNLTVESYKEQIKNPEILLKVREQLELDPEKYPLRVLANDLITIENAKNTNVITIKVRENNPELAAKIANTLAVNFSDFITQLAKKQASKSLEYIKTQLATEEKNLNQALLEYKKFLQQPRGVSELESEQTSKIKLLTYLKEKLAQIDINISIAETTLKEAQKQLSITEKTIITKKSLSEDPVLYSYVKNEKGTNTKETLTIEMKNEEINPIYIELKKKISNTQINLAEQKATKSELLKKIAITRKELEQLQVELAEKKHQSEILNRQVNLAQKTYNSFMDKYEESRITQSGKIGDTAVVVSSEAIVPVRPVAPKKALNLAIAGILGLMLAVFVAFFKEYWSSTDSLAKNSTST